MVAGHGLVQHQRRHLPLGAALRVVEIRLEITGSRAVAGAGRIGLRGAAALGRHRPDAVRQTRQLAEQARRLRIDALRDVAVARQQFARRLVEELRIAPQEADELGAAARESGAAHDRIHFRFHAAHFPEPRFVDLTRGQAGRGLVLQQHVVVGRAARQLRRRQIRARLRQVLAFEIAAKPFEGRYDGILDYGRTRDTESLALGLRDRGGEIPERRVERALRRIGDHLRADLHRDGLQRHTRGSPAVRGAQPELLRDLVEKDRNSGQSLEVRLVVDRRGESRCPDHLRQEQLRAEVLRDGIGTPQRQVAEVLLEALAARAVAEEDFARHALLGRQAGRVDRLDAAPECRRFAPFAQHGVGRQVVKTIVVARVADKGCKARVAGQRPLPVLAEDEVEFRGRPRLGPGDKRGGSECAGDAARGDGAREARGNGAPLTWHRSAPCRRHRRRSSPSCPAARP